ncbi:MAG: hypothetical protein LBI40_04080 [Treponema sp.]|jgi:hypothetical protein|nr:hypothetical protein [Treponema sp.]
MNIDLYLILLGLIFSFAWELVIRGSKRWQETWEAHIDRLENPITGPLYKTIYCSGKTYYSVSKINEIIAIVIIVVWFLLLIQHCISKYSTEPLKDTVISIILPIAAIIGTFFCIIILFLCGRTAGGRFKIKEKGEGFIERST